MSAKTASKKSSCALLLALALAICAPSGAAVLAQSSGPGAQAGQGDQPAADASASTDASFEDRVASFVAEFYLSGEERTDDDLQRLYATRVAYFGSGIVSRERVIADKRAYFARWPQRRYQLVRETLKVGRRPGGEKIYDVAFEYTFDVSSTVRTSRGRGVASLTMDLSRDGGRITSEGGKVLQRW